jgi:hypothetical protein
VECFLEGKTPLITFENGLEVVRILMACYLSAQEEKVIDLQGDLDLDNFVPEVAKVSFPVEFIIYFNLTYSQFNFLFFSILFVGSNSFSKGTWKPF